MTDSVRPRGLYFEEFQIGMHVITSGRTVTEADVVNFAGLSADYNQIHTDAEFARTTPFGRRIAHGLLVLSMVSGMAVQTGVLEGTIIAFREIQSWKFSKPVFLGDTIHADLEVVETRTLRRLGGGLVTLKIIVLNQDEEPVMSGTWGVLMASKPGE